MIRILHCLPSGKTCVKQTSDTWRKDQHMLPWYCLIALPPRGIYPCLPQPVAVCRCCWSSCPHIVRLRPKWSDSNDTTYKHHGWFHATSPSMAHYIPVVWHLLCIDFGYPDYLSVLLATSKFHCSLFFLLVRHFLDEWLALISTYVPAISRNESLVVNSIQPLPAALQLLPRIWSNGAWMLMAWGIQTAVMRRGFQKARLTLVVVHCGSKGQL